MAVISVQSPTTGVTYSVQIGGDTPTPTEQERINQYIAQQDAAVQGMMGGQSSSGAGEDTSWRGAVSYGLDQPLENIAITSNLLGGEGFGSFLSNLTDAPQGYQSATESFMEEDGFLSKLSYLPRAAVEQTGQFVGSVASRLAGSVLGGALGSAVAPGPGTVTGAGIGAFAGPAIFEGVQVLGPVALERARNNGRDVPNAEDWAGAFGTAAASGALNAIAPGLSGFFKKVAVEAGTEAVQSIVQQSGGSVATEAGLQVDPYQAVQEGILGGAGAAIITAPSAILGRKKEAAEDVLDKIDADLLEDQPEILDQISRGIIAEEGVPEQLATNDYAEQFRAFVPQKALGLPAPQAGSLAEIAGAGQPNITPAQTPAIGQAIGAEVPSVEVSPFRWSQYEAAKQSIIESGDATVPNIARAASSSGQPVTPAVAKKIRSQLEQDGVITSDPKAKGKYRATPESVKPVAMDESLRRSISDVTRDLEEARAARAKAEQDARRAAESGKKAEATVASRALSAADSMVKTSEATLNDLMVRLARAPAASTVPTTERPASRRVGMDAVIPAAQEPTAAVGAVAAQADIQTKEGRDAAVAARAGRLTQAAENYTAQAQQKIAAASSIEAKGRKVQLPKSEADRIASLRAEAARDMDAAKKLRSAAERASSDVQKMRERQAAEAARQVAATAAKSNRTPEYDARQAQLTNAMRQRLDGLGLKDVDVRGAPILEIEEARKGVLVEGMFDVEDGKRVISLSMGIYEPGASEADTLKKIAAVLDHEVIHALRNLGVIKDAEWKSLSSLAARQKYMREKDGKTVERQYTYLQRAERMNPDADPEVQVEEAVAEMYRDFAAGRLKIGGRPRSVMERIRDFFRAIIRSHKDVGITDPAAMFEAIKSGQIGARERAAPEAAPEPDADVDTVVPAETKPAARPSPQQKPQQTPEQQTKTKTQYEKTLEGSGAVERTLEKIGAVPIPYDTRLWDAESGTATYASGTSRVIDVGGRKVVIMNINGKRVPFYLSTGLGGKASVAPGKWYPFFGVSDSGWINKGSQQQINDFYGSNELRRAAEALNSEIGNIIRDDTIPKARLKGRHIDAINAGMSPVENGQPDTLSRFEENVRSVIAEISGSKKRMSRVSAATAKDRADYQSWATGPDSRITTGRGQDKPAETSTSQEKGEESAARNQSVSEAGSGTRLSGVRPEQTGDRRGRVQGRGLAPLEGAPRVPGYHGPDQRIVDVAERYARENGIYLRRQAEFVEVDPDRARRIAAAYEAMENNPSDPRVATAYEDMIRQTTAQYQALADAGYRFWFIDPSNDGGYGSTPWNAMRDLRDNQSMGVFPTDAGYGSDETEVDLTGNPLLADTGIRWPYGSPTGPMKPVLANDLFRAVHDAFGHGIEGSGFRARGEENAWQAHIRLFTGPAQGAMTSETRGQNSWLNYGPYGEKNQTAQVEDTVFAPQKIGLMPSWTWTEGRAADDKPYPSPESRRMSRRSAGSAMKPSIKKKVQANQSALMYARSADTIAKGLQLGRYGLDERRARKFVDGVLRRFQDSMLPVGRMIQELSAKGMDIVDAMDTYLQEEIMSRKTGALIEKNTKDLYEPMVALVKKLNVPAQRIDQLKRASTSAAGQKGFVERAIEQYGSSKMALAEAYLYARHAKERNRYILENKDDQNTKGSGMSDAEADAILRWFEALDPANKKVVADIGKYARLIVANTNQTRVEGGLISRDVVNAEEGDANQGTSYGFYVPLRGIINEDLASVDDAQYMPPATPRYGARGKEDRTALGRAEYASDILANLMTQNQNAIVRAERNKVGQSFLSLLRADPTMTESYAKILPTPPKIRDTVNGKIVMRTDPNAYKKPDILVVKEDGKETFVKFDDLSLAGALNGQNGFGPERGGAILRGMSMVNRYLASINTSYNPVFIITNAFRDIQTGLVNLNQFEIKGLSSEVAKNILPSIKGIAGAVLRGDTTSPWAKVYADFVENGGQNATNSFDTLEERVNDLSGLLSEISDAGIKGQWSRMKNSFVGQKGASLLNTVESINTAAENGIRVATYKALLDRGFTKERAAQAAGNVTVNFSKGGDYRRLMNGLFLFYNASIQGTFAMLNAATRSKKVRALWVGIMAAGFVNDMFNAMMSGEDDDGKLIYDKAQDYVLENNIILPDFLGVGERSYISIPMPYGLNMAYNLGRSVSRFMRGKYSVSDATSSIFGTAVDVLNPIGSGDAFLDLNTAAPTIADPIVDLLSNEDFAGRNIYKEALGFDRTPEPASQRYWSTTSPSAVWIAKNLNSLFGGNEVRPGPLDVSPDVIQFWFEFLTGGVGRFVQQSGESIARVGTGDFGEGFIENFPVFSRIVRTVSEREDMGSYIEGAERVLTAEAELKRAREVGDQQWAQRTIQRYGAELRIVGQIRSAETALRRLSRQRGEIESNQRIPEAQKAVMLDRIEERRQQVLARANAVLSSLD